MMTETESRDVTLLGESVEYSVHQSDEASESRIDVDIHGVTVVVPSGEDVCPTELLRENAAWVTEKRRTYEEFREAVPDRTFKEGEAFPYLGEEFQLVVEALPTHEVDDNTIRLRESTVAQSSIERVLEQFYRREARDHFTQRADYYAEQMGVSYEQIEVRNQRTKWGSCSTTGTLGLNWRLMMAPPEVVDYIIVHELAHLQEQNHTDRFWQLVGEQISEYQKQAEWLEQNSTQLVYTVDDL